jgi:hypothetical protein
MIHLTEDQAIAFRDAVRYLDAVPRLQYQPVDTYHTCIALSDEYAVDYVLLHLLNSLPQDVADLFNGADVQRDPFETTIVYFKNMTTEYTAEED